MWTGSCGPACRQSSRASTNEAKRPGRNIRSRVVVIPENEWLRVRKIGLDLLLLPARVKALSKKLEYNKSRFASRTRLKSPFLALYFLLKSPFNPFDGPFKAF